MHTDGFDEVVSCPTELGARIAVSTQNILREEAHLPDVIDPLGGSHYIESLTAQMEEEILRIMQVIEDAGGMYAAVEEGLVQRMIGISARRHQQKIEQGEEVVVGVNAYQVNESSESRQSMERPDPEQMHQHIEQFKQLKAARSEGEVKRALDVISVQKTKIR